MTLGIAGGGAVVPLGPVFANEVLGRGTEGFALLMTALGVGIAAAVVVISIAPTALSTDSAYAPALLGAGCAIVATASVSTLPVAATFVAGVGFGAAVAYATGFTAMQREVPDPVRGRAFGVLEFTLRLALLASLTIWPLTAAVLDEYARDAFLSLHGVQLALLGAGCLVVIAGAIAWFQLPRGTDRGNGGGDRRTNGVRSRDRKGR